MSIQLSTRRDCIEAESRRRMITIEEDYNYKFQREIIEKAYKPLKNTSQQKINYSAPHLA